MMGITTTMTMITIMVTIASSFRSQNDVSRRGLTRWRMVVRGSAVDNALRRGAIFTEDRHAATPQRSAHVGASRRSRARVRSANRVAGEQHKVRSDHRAPRVGAKRLIGAPCT